MEGLHNVYETGKLSSDTMLSNSNKGMLDSATTDEFVGSLYLLSVFMELPLIYLNLHVVRLAFSSVVGKILNLDTFSNYICKNVTEKRTKYL